MSTPTLDPKVLMRLQAGCRSASGIIVTILLSLVILACLSFIVVAEPTIGDVIGTRWKPMAFGFGGLFLAVIAILARRRALSAGRLDDVFHERGALGLIAHLVTSTVIGGAVAEAIGLLGLLGGLLLKDHTLTVRLCVIGALVAVMSYPRRSAWQRAVGYCSENGTGGSVADGLKDIKGFY